VGSAPTSSAKIKYVMKIRNKVSGYLPFKEWIWKSYDNIKIVDIDEFVSSHQDCQFYIGTDSQRKGKKCIFTIVKVESPDIFSIGVRPNFIYYTFFPILNQ
jgi:hypothetical protein